ncbi:MAG TPA: hypothetical protein VMR46_01130 [Candidatus Paceibacterota bacterium]|nr:hypothetical protein [Candidatus Paceibacterota bacterium]
MEMLALKNGSSVPKPAVIAIMMSVNSLWEEGLGGMCAVIDLVDRCKNPNHKIADDVMLQLKASRLIEPEGRIHEAVKDVVLSATEGEGVEMTIGSPVK